MQQKIVSSVKITPTEVKTFFDRIPKDSLPFFESELEVGQIVLFPKASRDLEQYIIAEMNNYKRQIETKVATFEQLANDIQKIREVKIAVENTRSTEMKKHGTRLFFQLLSG